ncbi:hypothetical protein L4X63_03155 [Geomonas sp. Red32]|uniref:hypothetical protein n=1 Tax=Geomonas sp. Red32 TaxID=2912856 RepID=UPI00202CD5F2|nr:hypothetical protein [Geomonas sp. Red32]MCM0080581.1 hypothetical protein [Geomonas sp. Red32]
MIRGKYDLSGKDSVFLSNILRYLAGLEILALYRNSPPGFPTLDELRAAVAKFKVCYEAAVNFDRLLIKKRKDARKEVTEMFKKVAHYIQSVANEENILEVLETGFSVRSVPKRKTAMVQAAE